MQDGQLRVDCNINLEQLSQDNDPSTSNNDDDNMNNEPRPRSARVEVKNLNSIQQVAAATNYEALRQAHEWYTNGQVGIPETRTWDVVRRKTVLIRRKDGQDDYRFLPEPDLPPLVLEKDVLQGLSLDEFLDQHLVELPSQAIERLQDMYGLTLYQAQVIARDPPAIAYFDSLMESSVESSSNDTTTAFAKVAANLLCNELVSLVKEQYQSQLNEEDEEEEEPSMAHSKVSPRQLRIVTELVMEESISTTMAKKLLSLLYRDDDDDDNDHSVDVDPRILAQEHNMRLISNPLELQSLCQQVLDEHPDELEIYQQGGRFVTKMKKLFTGKAMSASRGNAHPQRLQEVLDEVLRERFPNVK